VTVPLLIVGFAVLALLELQLYRRLWPPQRQRPLPATSEQVPPIIPLSIMATRLLASEARIAAAKAAEPPPREGVGPFGSSPQGFEPTPWKWRLNQRVLRSRRSTTPGPPVGHRSTCAAQLTHGRTGAHSITASC
jgi:hypothetical protein